jgi:hypothetical protein
MTFVFDDVYHIELLGILIDEDREGALNFLNTRFKGKVRNRLEDG